MRLRGGQFSFLYLRRRDFLNIFLFTRRRMNRSIDVVAAELEFGMRNAAFVMHFFLIGMEI